VRARCHLRHTIPFFLPRDHLVHQRRFWFRLACTLREEQRKSRGCKSDSIVQRENIHRFANHLAQDRVQWRAFRYSQFIRRTLLLKFNLGSSYSVLQMTYCNYTDSYFADGGVTILFCKCSDNQYLEL
jgi:hypothetical protein